MSAPRPSPVKSLFDKPFWEFAAAGELRLQRCADCATFRYPPAPCCPACVGERAEWVALSGRGRIASWTVFHRQYLPEMPAPYPVVSVETEEGPLLIGNLVGAGIQDVRIGAAVELVFEPVTFGSEPGNLPQWRLSDVGKAEA
jgi:uncharacterized OB-fold protein